MFDITKIVIDQRVPRNSTQKIEIKDEGAILNAEEQYAELIKKGCIDYNTWECIYLSEIE